MDEFQKRGAKEEWVFGEFEVDERNASSRKPSSELILGFYVRFDRSRRERVGQQGDLRDGCEGSCSVSSRVFVLSSPLFVPLHFERTDLVAFSMCRSAMEGFNAVVFAYGQTA